MMRSGWFILLVLGLLGSASIAALAADTSERVALVPGGESARCTVVVTDKTTDGLTLEVEIPYLDQDVVDIDGEIFRRLAIPGGALAGAVGEAALPTLTRLVAIPASAAVQIEVLARETTILDGPKLAPQDAGDGQAPTLDATAYASGPRAQIGVSVAEPALMAGLRIVPVTFRPVAYDPVTGELEVASRLEVKLSFSGRDERNMAAQTVQRHIPESFANIYEQYILGYERDAASTVGPGTYLMICPNNASVLAAVEPLADWRRRPG
jgi:hypothetical protein